MKSIYNAIVLSTLSLMLFACGSSVKITKRVHRDGYHVSISKKSNTSSRKEIKIKQEDSLVESKKSIDSVFDLEEDKEATINSTIAENESIVVNREKREVNSTSTEKLLTYTLIKRKIRAIKDIPQSKPKPADSYDDNTMLLSVLSAILAIISWFLVVIPFLAPLFFLVTIVISIASLMRIPKGNFSEDDRMLFNLLAIIGLVLGILGLLLSALITISVILAFI